MRRGEKSLGLKPFAYTWEFGMRLCILCLCLLAPFGCFAEVHESAPLGLLFTSDRANQTRIWLQDRERVTVLDEVPRDTIAWWPQMSPDGSVLLHYRSPRGGGVNDYARCELWRHSLITGQSRPLIPHRQHGWRAQSGARWSPDGSRLIMAAKTGEDDSWQLYTSSFEGTYPEKLTSGARQFHDPAWSPDGKQITYVAYPTGYQGIDPRRLEVHRANADGSGEVRLTFDAVEDHRPVWSPDGAMIAYESRLNKQGAVGSWAIRVVCVDASGNRSVVEDGHLNSSPSWGVAGESLYFHRSRNIQNDEVHVWHVRLDGRRLRRVVYSNQYSNLMAHVIRPMPQPEEMQVAEPLLPEEAQESEALSQEELPSVDLGLPAADATGE